MKIIREKHKHENGYNSKPKGKVEKIERECIGRGYRGGGCGKRFIAKGKFNRLCDACTDMLIRYG